MPEALSKTKLSAYRKFLQKKTRVAEGRFLLEGWHLLEEAVKGARRLRALVYDPSAARGVEEERILGLALEEAGEAWAGSAGQLAQLSDARTPQGVVAVVDSVGCRLEDLLRGLPDAGPVRLVLLDGLNDPGNCGTIVRSCDWFGVDGVIFGEGCAELENGKTARATMGALFHLPVAVEVALPVAVTALREQGIAVYTMELDESAVSLSEFEFPERCALVVGNEARGVSQEVSAAADGKLTIARFGNGESLNAASASAVALAMWRRRSEE